jgi:endoglycosylceramidase
LRGVNVDNAAKSDPQRMPKITQADAARIAGWGFDFVRLLVFWDAVEPQMGVIDSAYLDRVAERVAWFGAQGISVLLDMHQDVYAARFCCDGAPDWAIVDDGQPFQLQDRWGLNYLQPAVERAFDHFWNEDGSHPELADHYAGAWRAIAARFAGNPDVIGYDVMNEPFPGSDFNAAEALLRDTPDDGGRSKSFDQTKLGPFYQRIITTIRAVDPDTYVFFEPRYAAPGNGSPSFLPLLTDPRPGEAHLVYAPHLYPTIIDTSGAYPNEDPTLGMWEAARKSESFAQKCPLVLGEWGLSWSTPGAETYVDDLLTMADRMAAGWTYWSYDPGGPTGWAIGNTDGTDNPLADRVVRPYPRRVAGDPESWTYDPTARTFELVYRDRTGTSGPTEIALPAKRHYPDGWHLTVDPDAAGTWAYSWDASREIVTVTVPQTNGEHHVHVAPGAN